MKHAILVFIRIGSQKHIYDLYENGTVYMNPITRFKKIEDELLRGDPNEGAINLSDTKNGTFKIEGIDRDFNYTRLRYGEFLKNGNLFCLYAISSNGFTSPNDFKFDEKNLEFGSHCLMIKQPGVFIKRVEHELKQLGYNYKHGFVKYYEEKEHYWNLTPFHKPKAYEYQKEFRFFVEHKKKDPLKINIGSMESYSEIFETKDLLSLRLDKSKC
jgi:hypothetical protein